MPSDRGSLLFVGTGLKLAGQVTLEAHSAIQTAEKLFHIVQDVVTHRWLESLNPTAESLIDSYSVGKARKQSYEEMVERILVPVRQGRAVCVALYGHPGVFVRPSHEAIRRARAEGHVASMQPGVSAEDCLVADLVFDPGDRGCQSFEATDFLVRSRRFDPCSGLLLWQIGGIGMSDYRTDSLWNQKGVKLLARALASTYGIDHEVVVYEAAVYPVCDPKIVRCRLTLLHEAPVTIASTLFVPPLVDRPIDQALLASLQ